MSENICLHCGKFSQHKGAQGEDGEGCLETNSPFAKLWENSSLDFTYMLHAEFLTVLCLNAANEYFESFRLGAPNLKVSC